MSTDWQLLINDPSKVYEVKDSAVALIGDPLGSASEAQPYMVLEVRHVESSLEFDFMFALQTETVAKLGAVFTKMAVDIVNNGYLDQSIYDFDDEDEEDEGES